MLEFIPNLGLLNKAMMAQKRSYKIKQKIMKRRRKDEKRKGK